MKNTGKRSIPGWNLIEFSLLKGLAYLFNALSPQQADRLAGLMGSLIFIFLPKRREIALRNLDIVFPEAEPAYKKYLAKESFRNLCISLMELFRIPTMLQEVSNAFEIEGAEHMDKALARGKGIILACSHLGSWEYLSFLSYLKGYPFSVIVRDTRNPYIHQWLHELRKETTLIAINRENAVKSVIKNLKANKVVAVLVDQWASSEGLWVEFFGVPTSTTSLPARLASHTGAAIIPAYCVRTSPGKYKIIVQPHVKMDEEVEEEEIITRRLNSFLEIMIRQYPDQWTWSHRRWKSKEKYLQKKPVSTAKMGARQVRTGELE